MTPLCSNIIMQCVSREMNILVSVIARCAISSQRVRPEDYATGVLNYFLEERDDKIKK